MKSAAVDLEKEALRERYMAELREKQSLKNQLAVAQAASSANLNGDYKQRQPFVGAPAPATPPTTAAAVAPARPAQLPPAVEALRSKAARAVQYGPASVASARAGAVAAMPPAAATTAATAAAPSAPPRKKSADGAYEYECQHAPRRPSTRPPPRRPRRPPHALRAPSTAPTPRSLPHFACVCRHVRRAPRGWGRRRVSIRVSIRGRTRWWWQHVQVRVYARLRRRPRRRSRRRRRRARVRGHQRGRVRASS
jgi:hypothetical protein